MPFVVRMLGDRMYGLWILVGTFVGYYGLVDLGLSSAVNRFMAKAAGAGDHDECNRVYNTALRLYTGLGLVVLVLTLVCAALAPLFCKTAEDASLLRKLILILGINFAFDFPSRVYNGVLSAHLHFELLAIIDLLSLVLRTGLIVAALLAGYKVIGLGWAVLISGIPAKLLPVYFAYRNHPFLSIASRYWRRDVAKLFFSYSVYTFIAQVADLLRIQLVGPVVAAFVGLAAVTHYKVAGTLAQYYLTLMAAVTGAFGAVFSRQEGARDYEGMKKTFFFTSKITFCIASFIGFGLIAWGKPFISRWMGPRYLDAYPCLVVLVVGWLCGLSQTASVGLLFGTSQHKFFALFNSIEGVANLLLSLLLVRWYGIVGVALGTMIPMVITKLLIQPVYLSRVTNIDYFQYVRKMGRSLVVIAGSLVIPLVLSLRFATPDYKALLAVGLLSMISYGLALWLFEFSPSETRILVRAISPRLGSSLLSPEQE